MNPLNDTKLFQVQSFELIERDEILVINKVARVVEEIVIDKIVAQKQQTIRETLRRQDVEIERSESVAQKSEVRSQESEVRS
jgi:stress response protein YsnF